MRPELVASVVKEIHAYTHSRPARRSTLPARGSVLDAPRDQRQATTAITDASDESPIRHPHERDSPTFFTNSLSSPRSTSFPFADTSHAINFMCPSSVRTVVR